MTLTTENPVLKLERLLTVKEVAYLLKLHPNTIRALTDSGQLECIRIGRNSHRRFTPAAIREYIERNTR